MLRQKIDTSGLVQSLKQMADPLFRVNESANQAHVTVDISDFNQIKEAQILVLTDIFFFLFMKKANNSAFTVTFKTTNDYFRFSSGETFRTFLPKKLTEKKMDYLLQAFLGSPLLSSLLIAMQMHGEKIPKDDWVLAFATDIKSNVTYIPGNQYTCFSSYYFRNIQFLFSATQDINIYNRLLFPLLWAHIEYGTAKKFLTTINTPFYWNIICDLELKQSLLFHAFNCHDKETFDWFLKEFKWEKVGPNLIGNTLLHYVKTEDQLAWAYLYTESINHQNDSLATPLHYAAETDNLMLAQSLLLKGANPDIKNCNGQTFWSKPSYAANQNLTLYRKFKLNGSVLRYPPKQYEQKGPHCGYYAVSCASEYYRMIYPQDFTTKALPPRKSDLNPRAQQSLRELRKEVGLKNDIVGLFSTQKLRKIIALTECQSETFNYQTFDEFMQIIKEAINNDHPVLLPFAYNSSELRPDETADPYRAHWVTVIGYHPEHLLVAQYGELQKLKAVSVYNAAINLVKEFPVTEIKKPYQTPKVKGKHWVINKETILSVEQFNQNPSDFKIKEGFKLSFIHQTSLAEDFAGKLVVVYSPKHQLKEKNLLLKQ